MEKSNGFKVTPNGAVGVIQTTGDIFLEEVLNAVESFDAQAIKNMSESLQECAIEGNWRNKTNHQGVLFLRSFWSFFIWSRSIGKLVLIDRLQQSCCLYSKTLIDSYALLCMAACGIQKNKVINLRSLWNVGNLKWKQIRLVGEEEF
jgi:hypothetical protein